MTNSHFSVSRLPHQDSWSYNGLFWLCFQCESSNIFLLLQLEPINASCLLKSQFYCYNTQAATCFGLYWPIIIEHAIVQDGSLTFSACSRTSENLSVCNMWSDNWVANSPPCAYRSSTGPLDKSLSRVWYIYMYIYIYIVYIKQNVKQSHYRPGQAQKVPGS